MPPPPLVPFRLRIPFRRVLPVLLPSHRRHVQVAPYAAHRLIAAIVDEVRAIDLVLIVAEEHVVSVPLVDTEVLIEIVRDGVPGNLLPAHPLLQTREVLLRSA